MKVLQQKAAMADNVLGKQEGMKGDAMRFLTYCVAVPCDNGVLIYNVMTKEMLLLEGEEGTMIDADNLGASQAFLQGDTELSRYLYENWYIVPQAHNDKQLCLSLCTIARQLYETNMKGCLNSFTILTTTDCNARCFYCYEKGCEQVNMSDETAYNVVEFIKRSCGGREVSLHWYGGEPLFNIAPIDIITNGLERGG